MKQQKTLKYILSPHQDINQLNCITFQPKNCILEEGIILDYTYVLLQGEAAIVNQYGNILHTFRQGDTINLTQSLFMAPSLKTVKALTSVLISKNSRRQKTLLDSVFENLQQNCPIPFFRSLKITEFCEICNYHQTLKKPKKSKLFLESNYYYFIKNGQILASENQNNTKLAILQTGEIIIQSQGIYYETLTNCEIWFIYIPLMKNILQSQFSNLQLIIKQRIEFLKCRKVDCEKLMYRLAAQRRSYDPSLQAPSKFRRHFRSRYSQYQHEENRSKIKSCTQQKKKYQKIKNNFHKQLCNLNRLRYGKVYLYEKRLQINKDLNRRYSQQKDTAGFMSLYQPHTLKETFGIINKFVRKKYCNNKQNQKITIASVRKVRMNFQKKSQFIFDKYNRSIKAKGSKNSY